MIYPTGTKVVVKPDTAEEITKGGIYVPDTVRENQQHAITRGHIVAIGPSAEIYICERNDHTGITKRQAIPGDRCMFVKYAGAMFRIEGSRDEYRILQDVDIVCCLDGNEKEPMPDTRKSMVK